MVDDKKALEEIAQTLLDIRDQLSGIREALQKIADFLEDFRLPPQARI